MRTHVEIPRWAAQLIVMFLDDLSEKMGNAGCNDYTVPEGVPLDELRAACKASNGGDDCGDSLIHYDHAVVDGVRWVITEAMQ